MPARRGIELNRPLVTLSLQWVCRWNWRAVTRQRRPQERKQTLHDPKQLSAAAMNDWDSGMWRLACVDCTADSERLNWNGWCKLRKKLTHSTESMVISKLEQCFSKFTVDRRKEPLGQSWDVVIALGLSARSRETISAVNETKTRHRHTYTQTDRQIEREAEGLCQRHAWVDIGQAAQYLAANGYHLTKTVHHSVTHGKSAQRVAGVAATAAATGHRTLYC